jgi:Ca2+-binding RTX toxin-like protein
MTTFHGSSLRDKLYGTRWSDVMHGNAGDDYLNGQGGNDVLFGGDGNDKLCGGEGNDKIDGGSGIDALFGGAGADLLLGGGGDDYLNGGEGFGQLIGGAGKDRLQGGEGTNDLYGEDGDDVLVLEESGSVLENQSLFSGGSGHDTLYANANGAKLIDTWSDSGRSAPARLAIGLDSEGPGGTLWFQDSNINPTLIEYAGIIESIEEFKVAARTRLDFYGGSADTVVTGGDFDDFFQGGSGNEVFRGAAGADTFHMAWGGPGTAMGQDRIEGFSLQEGDRIITSFKSHPEIGLKTAVTEMNGHTIYTTTLANGTVIHTLDVDAVGLPPAWPDQPWA